MLYDRFAIALVILYGEGYTIKELSDLTGFPELLIKVILDRETGI